MSNQSSYKLKTHTTDVFNGDWFRSDSIWRRKTWSHLEVCLHRRYLHSNSHPLTDLRDLLRSLEPTSTWVEQNHQLENDNNVNMNLYWYWRDDKAAKNS